MGLPHDMKDASVADALVQLIGDLSQGRYNTALPPHQGNAMDDLIQALVCMRDDLQAREKKHRATELRLSAIIDKSAEGILTVDESGRILSLNSSALQMFGCEPDDILGADLHRLLPLHYAGGDDDPVLAIFRGGFVPPEGCERSGARADGSEFPVWLTVAEIAIERERQFVVTVQDISSRKEAEKELRESETRFRDIAGSASDWFWETDRHHRLTFVSERIGSMLGVKPAAIMGFSYFDIGLADYDADLAAAHAHDLDEHLPFRDLVFPVGPDGAKDGKIIRISGMPIFDEDGGFQGYRGIGADVTREVLAERRARQAQQQLADAIESINDGIAVYDGDDRLVLSNREYLRLFQGLADVLNPGIRFADILAHPNARAVFDTGEVDYDRWVRIRLDFHSRANGEAFITHTRDGRSLLSREYRTHDGGIVAVRTDITELKLREAELDRLQRRYQLILDAAGDGIVGLDRDGMISFANRAAADLLGIAADRLVGCDFVSTVRPLSQCGPGGQAIQRARLNGQAEKVGDESFRRADGSEMPVDYLVAPIIEFDTVQGAVLVFRDVTLRRQYENALENQQAELERLVAERTAELSREVLVRTRTESALRESRERLKGITDSLFEGVVVSNATGHVVFANRSARRLLDWEDGQEMEGLPLDELLRLKNNGQILTFEQAPWARVMQSGVTERDDDAQFVTLSGKTLEAAYACSALPEESGRNSAVISFRDMETLKAAQREALQSSRLASVGQLAAGIAHEINTPIQYVGDNLRFIAESVADLAPALKLAAQVADRPDLQQALVKADADYLLGELPTAIDQSLEGVAQVARIVLSMKEFSHPGTTHKTMADINRALDSTLIVSRNTWKQVARVETHFAPDLPAIACHQGEMNQVFLNLIINAAHAIESSGKPLPGIITITTARVGTEIMIKVQDSGTGIPAAIRERIFDPFFTTKVVGKGTGQGLAICLDVITHKHGGRIDVGGKEGEGAIFTIWLPLDGEASARDT